MVHNIRCNVLGRRIVARPLNLLRNIQTSNDMSKDGVIFRESRAIILEIDKELAPCRVRSGSLRHSNRTSSIIAFNRLIINAIAGASRSVPFRIATLYYSSRKNTMELQTIVEMVLGKVNEVIHRMRSQTGVEF